jgi:hypothetical protein
MFVLSSLAAGAQSLNAAEHSSMVFTDQFLAEEMVNVYPNPVIDVLNIEVHQPEDMKLTVQIRDVIGKIIYNNTTGVSEGGTYLFQVHMPNAAPGMYLYNIMDIKGDVVANGKFVKQ